MPDVIQSLWVRAPLGSMQNLSMKSYVANGHPFILYTYDANLTAPAGVQVLDANEIVPQVELKRFRHLANFSDEFRYAMLYRKGGWWVDLDTVCLRPFDFPEEYVFASEATTARGQLLNGGFIKAPKRATILEAALKECDTLDPMSMGWGAMGPQLLDRLVREFGMQESVRPPAAFNPVPWWDSPSIFTQPKSPALGDAYAVHLWNEMWGRKKMDKEARYPTESLYEILKQRYL